MYVLPLNITDWFRFHIENMFTQISVFRLHYLHPITIATTSLRGIDCLLIQLLNKIESIFHLITICLQHKNH